MAGRKAFAAACAFRSSAEHALEFVQPGMFGGSVAWRGQVLMSGFKKVHGFKKVGMFAARLQ
jgi:hypothetical protein